MSTEATETTETPRASGEVVTYGDLAVGDTFRLPGGVAWFRVLEVERGTYPMMVNLKVRFWAESGDERPRGDSWISKLAADPVHKIDMSA